MKHITTTDAGISRLSALKMFRSWCEQWLLRLTGLSYSCKLTLFSSHTI